MPKRKTKSKKMSSKKSSSKTLSAKEKSISKETNLSQMKENLSNDRPSTVLASAPRKGRKIQDTNIGTIPEEEKLFIQKKSEELRLQNLGYYDFSSMICRIHNIPLKKYKTLSDQTTEPFARHCEKCIPIPESWEEV